MPWTSRAKTIDAFNYYVKLTEARVDQEVKRPGAFLYFEGLPEQQRSQIRAAPTGAKSIWTKCRPATPPARC